MPVSLGGSNLEDPKALRDDMLRGGLPVGPWAELCNSFASPCEREPGVAHVLIRKADWTRVSDQTNLAITFTDHGGTSVSFVKLTPVSAPTPLPQEYAPADPVLWLTLHDRRARYRQVAVNRGYNVRAASGGWETATLNSGTAWSWAGVISDLWDKLKAVYTDLSSSPPSLPSTPSGTPESFYFYSMNAWDALCTVCQAGGLLVRYDPTTDTTTIIDPAASAPVEPVLAVRTRTWDTAGNTDIPEAVPAAVTLSYHRIGLSDRHQISAAITESGTTTGAAVVLPGYPAAAGNPVTNTTYLTAFAERVRDFWRRDLMARAEPREVQYRGYQAWCLTAVGLGGWAGWSVSQLAGDEVQTALVSGPLLRLDPGEPYPTSSASATRPKYPLTPPCASFGTSGGFTGSYQVWFDPETGEAECIFTPPCPDCTSEGTETPGVGGAPPSGTGIAVINGGAWGTPGPLTGDVTTTGLVVTIGAGKVLLSMLANVATGTVFYRKTAGSGAPEVQTLATLIADLGALGTTFQPLDPELTAIAGLTSAADTLPYFTGSGTAALAAFTVYGRTLAALADAAAGRTALGLGTAATESSGAFAAAVHTHSLSALTQSGATTGQVATWDGAAWVPQTPSGGGGGSATYTAFVQDLGAARRSGSFDLTGLSGLTTGKAVAVVQTLAPIPSKGGATDEPEFDLIRLTGRVTSATTIRVTWQADAVVVGEYAFAYMVSA